jgi:hypothetical protein
MDYSEYVRQQGQQIDLTPIQKGIDSFMKNRKEAIITKANELSNTTYSGFVKPWEDFTSTDVGSWDVNTLPTMTAGEALESYKNSAKEKGQKVYNELLNAGKFDPKIFKEEYEKIQKTAMPTIERKLENYMGEKDLSDKEMRAFIAEKGLGSLLINHGNEANLMRTLAMPEEKGFFGKAKENITGSQAAALAGSAYFAPKLASSLYEKGFNPFRPLKSIKEATPSPLSAKKSDKLAGIVDKSGIIKSNEANRLKEADKILKDANKKFNKNKKAYKGKSYARTVAGKADKAAIEAAKAGKKAVTSTTKNVVRRAIDKHGAPKVMKLLTKRLGKRKAIMMLAKLGLSAPMQLAPGVGQAASAALLGYDAYHVYNILKELAE